MKLDIDSPNLVAHVDWDDECGCHNVALLDFADEGEHFTRAGIGSSVLSALLDARANLKAVIEGINRAIEVAEETKGE